MDEPTVETRSPIVEELDALYELATRLRTRIEPILKPVQNAEAVEPTENEAPVLRQLQTIHEVLEDIDDRLSVW